jgi:hypothetical protein
MKITRDNYEPWFLDYLEGNLEEGMIDEFIRFIRENPDLKEELQLFEPVRLEKPHFSFPGKENLFKENFDLSDIFDETAVAWMEGDLDSSSVAAFKEYLHRHPEKNKELELFNLVKLQPDLSVTFRAKKKLYHQPVILLSVTRAMQIAAILLVALVVFPLIEKNQNNSGPGSKIFIVSRNTDPVKQDNKLVTQNKKNSITPPTLSDNRQIPSSTIREELPVLVSAFTDSREFLLPQNEPGIAAPSLSPVVVEIYADTELASTPLTDKIIEKIGLPEINLSKIARWGLKLAANLSGEKFSYDTNPEGEVIAYNLDTRLLGLSIPVRNK